MQFEMYFQRLANQQLEQLTTCTGAMFGTAVQTPAAIHLSVTLFPRVTRVTRARVICTRAVYTVTRTMHTQYTRYCTLTAVRLIRIWTEECV